MDKTRLILTGILGTGVCMLCLGIYFAFKPDTQQSQTQAISIPILIPNSSNIPLSVKPKTSTPNCVVSYSAGSCWTISNPPQGKSGKVSSDVDFFEPSIKILGNNCVFIVPASASNGVKGCSVQKGQTIEISATGTALFSTDHPRPDANGLDGWYDPYVDSPFKQNVGGLEFSIGSLSTNRYFAGNYYKGIAEESGELIFRVIDRKGYRDNKSGGFKGEVIK